MTTAVLCELTITELDHRINLTYVHVTEHECYMVKRTSVLCILLLLSVIEKWREPGKKREGER